MHTVKLFRNGALLATKTYRKEKVALAKKREYERLYTGPAFSVEKGETQ